MKVCTCKLFKKIDEPLLTLGTLSAECHCRDDDGASGSFEEIDDQLILNWDAEIQEVAQPNDEHKG